MKITDESGKRDGMRWMNHGCDFLKKNKGIIIVLLLAVLGLCMLMGGDVVTKAEVEQAADEQSYESVRFYTEELEKRIADECPGNQLMFNHYFIQ